MCMTKDTRGHKNNDIFPKCSFYQQGTKREEKEREKRGKQKGENKASKKLRLQVSSLQKQLDDQTQLSAIAQMIKEERDGTISTANTDEKSISMAQKVMKIVGKEKKGDNS